MDHITPERLWNREFRVDIASMAKGSAGYFLPRLADPGRSEMWAVTKAAQMVANEVRQVDSDPGWITKGETQSTLITKPPSKLSMQYKLNHN